MSDVVEKTRQEGLRKRLTKATYGVREAAYLMGISPNYVRELCLTGKISGEQVEFGTTAAGSPVYRWSIPREEIERFRRLPPPRQGRPRGWKPGD